MEKNHNCTVMKFEQADPSVINCKHNQYNYNRVHPCMTHKNAAIPLLPFMSGYAS